MKRIGAAFAMLFVVTAAILGYNWLMRLEVVAVRDACNTFAPPSAPSGAPRIEQSRSGSVLIVYFAPARSDEAGRIVSAARFGQTMLEIGGRVRITVTGLTDDGGGLVIPFKTEQQVYAVREVLCVGDER
jgi:hypothetical protein